MNRRFRSAVLSVSILLSSALFSSAGPAFAAAPKVLGTYEGWQSYLLVEGNKRTCYMASAPQKKEPATAKRGNNVLLFVTHRPADNERNVVNIHVGYTLNANRDVRVMIDKKAFDLFTKGETAWTRDNKDDKAMVDDMMKGSTLTVSGESDRGTKTVDTYSLKGFSAAYKEINKACGIK